MFKLVFDYCFALLLAMFLLPVIIITAILIKLDSKGPILFCQTRVGKGGNNFTIYKFRTMHTNNAGSLFALKGDKRITNIGKRLRRYRIDEIPQLINIFIGDMSIVGPRPLVRQTIRKYAKAFAIVHSVKPGITGLSAIKYHHQEEQLIAASIDPSLVYEQKIMPRKLRYEIFYVNNQSLLLDLKIIYWTATDFMKKILK
ncbi:MAG: sugar transferase [Pseudomonadota bacterium]